MKHLFFFLIISLFTSTGRSQFVGLNNSEVATLKKLVKEKSDAGNLYKSLKKLADESLGESPNPVDTVVSEGHLATDPKKIITVRSLRDIDRIFALSFAYTIENKDVYLNKLDQFLSAWATMNKPQGNPINDTKFENIFVAYDLVRNKIPTSARQNIDNWLTTMADQEINTGKNKAKTTSRNNWNSHRLKVIGLIGFLLNNDTYKKYIEEQLPAQIGQNLYPDGTGFDFHERDALHYHSYTLEPLISLATVVKRATGKDYYHYVSPAGSSIKKSIDFFIPFVTGEKTHPEFVNSKSSFDKKRADNKEAGFEIGADFVPTKGVPVLVQASYFQPECMKAVKKALGNNSNYPEWQAVLNDARK